MILLGFLSREVSLKYHRSIMIFTFSLQGTSFFILFYFVFDSFLMFKIKITINQLTDIECPNLGSQFGHSMPAVRAISAHHLFSRCSSLVLWVPVWWAQIDRLTGCARVYAFVFHRTWFGEAIGDVARYVSVLKSLFQ